MKSGIRCLWVAAIFLFLSWPTCAEARTPDLPVAAVGPHSLGNADAGPEQPLRRQDRTEELLLRLGEQAAERAAQSHGAAEAAALRAQSFVDTSIFLLTLGLTSLAVFAVLFTLGGFFISYLSAAKYREQAKNKAEAFARYELEMQDLLERSKGHEKTLSELVKKDAPSERHTPDIIEQARQTVKEGKGAEVLWGKAILAQEAEAWPEALAFWSAVLEDDPKDENALFGASLAATHMCLATRDAKESDRLYALAEGYYKRLIAGNENHAAAWSNWGNLLDDRAKAATTPDEKNSLWDMAEEKYRRATQAGENHANAWSNWGTLLDDKAKAATAPDEKNSLRDMAEEKYRRATQADENHAVAWFNWLQSLLCRFDDTAEQSQKRELINQARKVLARGEAADRNRMLYNAACLEMRDNNPDKAMRLLEEAFIASALLSVAHMENDSDLDPLREREDFKALLEKARAREAGR